MTLHRRRCTPIALLRSLVVWAVLALILWLDRDGCLLAQRADIFSAIWAAITVVANILGDVGGAIATTLEGVVAYLASAVAWLAGRVADILTSTGGMFARVWDGLKIVWNDVLSPFFRWLDAQLTRVVSWLKATLKPVFDWLQRVRDELKSIYNRFVKPIIDTIEFLRQLNRVLLAFHLHFLQKLDTVLQTIEQRIEEPILWLNEQLNKIFNALDLVLTFDGFLQRLTLIRSLNRYVPDWLRIATNSRMGKLSGDEAYRVGAKDNPQPIPDTVEALAAWTRGEHNDTGDVLDAAVSRAVEFTTSNSATA